MGAAVHGNALLLVLSIYLMLGVGAGFLSGLFGAGGGLVMVPGLVFLFQWESMDPAVAMHVAVGTSLAAMVPLALRSLLSHMQHQVSFFSVYEKMAPGVFVGVVMGGLPVTGAADSGVNAGIIHKPSSFGSSMTSSPHDFFWSWLASKPRPMPISFSRHACESPASTASFDAIMGLSV